MLSVAAPDTGPVNSGIPEMRWPAVPGHAAARLLALQYQLDATQWLAPAELVSLQMSALTRVLEFARATVPYYRDDPAYAVTGGAPLDVEAWARLPVLTRATIQDAGDRFASTEVPADHLPVKRITTSGSTGRPLSVLATEVTNLFWLGVTLRENRWHRRDVAARMAVIRPDPARKVPPEGLLAADWGMPIGTVFATGPLGLMSLQTDVAAQAQWLTEIDPQYVLTLPSNLLALVQHFRASGTRLPRLRQVCSMGETLTSEVRAACREVLGVGVTDMYSSQELGYVALQCPDAECYHVQSEVVYVEVLDVHGAPCRPGQTGRVVVTPLHNFAMPLVRYEVGDYAEVGGPCRCGRGLPVLNRIMGRQRNMLTLPTGERLWPTFAAAWQPLEAIRQIQLVQTAPDAIRARIVGPRPLTTAEEATFTSELGRCLGYPFEVSFAYLDAIDRSENMKFEDFVSLVPTGAAGDAEPPVGAGLVDGSRS